MSAPCLLGTPQTTAHEVIYMSVLKPLFPWKTNKGFRVKPLTFSRSFSGFSPWYQFYFYLHAMELEGIESQQIYISYWSNWIILFQKLIYSLLKIWGEIQIFNLNSGRKIFKSRHFNMMSYFIKQLQPKKNAYILAIVKFCCVLVAVKLVHFLQDYFIGT